MDAQHERHADEVEGRIDEHDGDLVPPELFERLNRTFITPLEREDIHDLASGLDGLMEYVANHDGLFRRTMPPPVLRFTMVASLIPVVVFLVSIPIAFVDTQTALLSWILIWPLEVIVHKRLRPEDAVDYF